MSTPAELLSAYHAKRDFGATPEPDGRRDVRPRSDGATCFVIQRHRARRLHYDLRLEVDGVLASWAVPKGPTLDPAVKSFAARTEDHPLDYRWFEGVIPSGYGKGDMIVWDDGVWEPDPEDDRGLSPAEAIRSGDFKFVLRGRKLGGRFALINTKGDDWLLLHKRGPESVPGWSVDDHPRSVLSGRTNDDVVANVPAHWVGPTDEELDRLAALPANGTWNVGGIDVGVSNLDKVLIPGRDGCAPITKRELIAYSARIAPWVAPYLCNRPVNLQRFPNGIGEKGFWHKAVTTHAPDWVRRWTHHSAREGRTREYLVIDGAPAMAWVANLGAIDLHPWTSSAATPENPSYALIDIDPGPTTTWDETVLISKLFRTAVQHLGLVARPKVTGQRGIQIWIPVRRGLSFSDTSDFVERLSRTVGRTVPDLVSWKWTKSEREGKARLDYTQNAWNKTLVAPYSVRPAPGAPVSVPLEWDELDDPDLRPDRWTIRDVLARLADRGDPFTALVGVEQDVPAL